MDFARFDIRPGVRILDIGCGPGRHTCAAAELEGATVIGADLCFEDIAEAKNRLVSLCEEGVCHYTWGLLCADILKLPFEDAAFDVVICAEVLEHIKKQHSAMAEIIRVLKPGGQLAVSVPRFYPELICWKLSSEYTDTDMGHVRIYKKKQLIALLEKNNVHLLAHHYAHSLHAPFWWLKCLVGPKRDDSLVVNLYHRLLVWDLMEKPKITRLLERLLDPILGKSLVLYLKKGS